ncbi:MAG: caspase family protein [Candidatus Thermoplasmatota archaeon]|nr:caspase family protein [Candidatus Thermoplasmatota archaeon]
MKKILIGLVVCMFIFSSLPLVVGDEEANEHAFKVKEFIETRDIIPVYTEHGLEKNPTGRGGGKNRPPSVTITNPPDGATVSGIVTITVNVYDKEDDPDPTPTIKIDGVTVAVAFSYEWDTGPVSEGSHTITATAIDSGGKTGSDSITVYKGGGPNPVNKYALVIGISDYVGTVNDLEYCDDDAVDWKNFLEDQGYSVTILTDSQATASNIDAAVDALLASEDGNDYVVFTYSGHGTKYQLYGSCIVSHDLYYMSHGWLESKFSNADSQHIYFAFDACVIGDFKGLINNNRVGAFASNKKYSYDGDSTMQNGVFTYYQMLGWNYYNSFEEDGAYAVQQMKNWASVVHVAVDPFVKDNYVGLMIP